MLRGHVVMEVFVVLAGKLRALCCLLRQGLVGEPSTGCLPYERPGLRRRFRGNGLSRFRPVALPADRRWQAARQAWWCYADDA